MNIGTVKIFPKKIKRDQSRWAATIEMILQAIQIEYVKECEFHPNRKWRADFALPQQRILIEYEGGTWGRGLPGGHTSGKGYSKDCSKYNAAQELGWIVLRYTADMLQKDAMQVKRNIETICKRMA